ncbi:MAG: FtsW/RodA/SpoVE family cell cycle protein [Candidatus Levyibacteriota bacterium]|nr:MAG: FtsW/RodA/SpoVE family cell cycle protein [Candidatus Levybacteria bacterium]
MKKIDIALLATALLLTLFGLLMIYDASSFIAFRDFLDKYHYIKEQFRWATLGFLGLLVFSYIDYHKLYSLAFPGLIVALVLLLLVFVPGIGVYVLGSRRWINTGFFILQPAEFAKLALAIYLSAWFSKKEKGRSIAFFMLLGLVVGLIMLEPDMGTASIVLFEALIAFFLSGGSIALFFLLGPVVALFGFIFIKLEPYRFERLTAFLKPIDSLSNSSYHIKQILIAFGMGGFGGVGLGNSIQKYAYLPENTTDSIFAIIAEELGFIGSFILILVYIILIWRGFLIASCARDTFGKLLAGTIISFLSIQIIINLMAQTVLIPLTGVPLPFISYGGSALVVDLCAIGILLNIAKQGNMS